MYLGRRGRGRMRGLGETKPDGWVIEDFLETFYAPPPHFSQLTIPTSDAGQRAYYSWSLPTQEHYIRSEVGPNGAPAKKDGLGGLSMLLVAGAIVWLSGGGSGGPRGGKR